MSSLVHAKIPKKRGATGFTFARRVTAPMSVVKDVTKQVELTMSVALFYVGKTGSAVSAAMMLLDAS